MSIAEIERFVADLKSNEALRAEVEKAQGETSMVAFAGTKGYTFTADEVKAYAKAMAKAAGKELTDEELDGVAAGVGDSYKPGIDFEIGGITKFHKN
jgi:predicted ribosomally synthesized peptide with nif11-like leader